MLFPPNVSCRTLHARLFLAVAAVSLLSGCLSSSANNRDRTPSTSLTGFAPEEEQVVAVAWPADSPSLGAFNGSTTSCLPGIETGCTTPTGAGTATCGPSGNSFGACALLSCAPGFALAGQSCAPAACDEGDIAPCAGASGAGSMSCSAAGVWGSCVMSACVPGFRPANGSCEPESCDPGESQPCAGDNGIGAQSCGSDGWNRCVLASCAPGFHLQLGQCVNNTCTPGAVTACQDATGIGSGLQACNAVGSGFGACVLSSCAAGYELAGGVCVSLSCSPGQTRACPVPNGVGTQACGGEDWGTCAPTRCQAGFALAARGQCEPTRCKPGGRVACQAPDGIGSGSMSCDPRGDGFEPCELSACRSGYTLAGGLCVTVGDSPAPAAPPPIVIPAAVTASSAPKEGSCSLSNLGATRPCTISDGASGLRMCSATSKGTYEWSSCEH